MQVPALKIPVRWAALYDQLVKDCAKVVQDAVAAVLAISDRAERAKAATDVLKVLGEANGALAKQRQEDIRAMRAAGMSYRQIGAALEIHFTRVRQIESGNPMGNSALGRAAKNDN